ncbi:MAG: hypothetical protein Q7S39_04270, partial [Ignavibacteria bacterium]|nr:hypothetical protein [Ignavibacteria bacterium]
WKNFIFSHHYEVHNNFFDSTMGMFPRRTGEVFWANYMEAKWTSKNTAPHASSLDELWDWYSKFLKYEN